MITRQILVLLLLTIGLLSGCGAVPGADAPPSSTTTVPALAVTITPRLEPVAATLGESVVLAPGEWMSVEAEGLQLHYRAVLEDSRCPDTEPEVECYWPGQVKIGGELLHSGKALGSFALAIQKDNMPMAESVQHIGPYQLELLAIGPDYLATLRATRVEEAATLTSGSTPTLELTGTPAPDVERTPLADGFLLLRTETFQGVLVPEVAAADFAAGLLLEDKAFWGPTEADVLALEAGLADFLRETTAERSPDLWLSIGTYRRQYLGVVRDGQRLVYANLFCHEPSAYDWQRLPVFVLDGGACFVQVLYNPATNTFLQASINGEA